VLDSLIKKLYTPAAPQGDVVINGSLKTRECAGYHLFTVPE
jgi:hypothetical protein